MLPIHLHVVGTNESSQGIVKTFHLSRYQIWNIFVLNMERMPIIIFSWMCFLICTCFSDHSCAVTTRQDQTSKVWLLNLYLHMKNSVHSRCEHQPYYRDKQQGITVVCFFDFLLIASGRDSTNNVEADR
jgi:hypothetical protein